MRTPILAALALALAGPARADPPPAQMPPFGRSVFAAPMVLYDDAGAVVSFRPASATGSVTAYTAGTASGQALPPAPRRFLAIVNESPSTTIACAFGAPAAISTAGSFTIPAGATRVWGSAFVPADAVQCVAAAAGTPVTLQAY